MVDKFVTALWLIFALVVSCIVIGGGGYALGYYGAKAKGDTALSELRQASAEATAKAANDARLWLIAEAKLNNRLAQELADAKTAHAQEKQSLLRRISRVTTVYVPAPGAAPQPLPPAVFTTGFVHEYNTAIGLSAAGTNTVAAGPGGTPEATTAVDAWLRDSGLVQADILGHIADYGERCRNIEAQVNRLLDREEADDGLR